MDEFKDLIGLGKIERLQETRRDAVSAVQSFGHPAGLLENPACALPIEHPQP